MMKFTVDTAAEAGHVFQHASSFADLRNDLDEINRPDANPKPTAKVFQGGEARIFVENCGKCGGSGAWNAPSSLGHSRCTKCGGTGRVTFKTSPEHRASRKTSSLASKVDKAAKEAAKRAAVLLAFEEKHPEIAAWWTGNDFEFAVKMRDAVLKWGSLTDGQMAAVLRLVEKRKVSQADRAARTADAPVVSIEAIEKVFATATGNGLNRPVLRLAGFKFSLAKKDSPNAGAIYVKSKSDGEEEGKYLGKVMGGKFMRSRDCSDDQQADILRVAASPEDAAIAYGRLMGACSICGRTLENKESVERGIGPICYGKFFA